MYSGSYEASSPDLVYVGPGVQVIADYDEPIFYSDGYYWRETGGVWYRSSYYTGGWVYASAPRAVISIREPYRYRRYRPAGYTPRNRTVVRDRRTQPAPRDNREVVRDRREERREQIRDNREEHREKREERNEERRDRRDERKSTPVIRDHR